MPSFADSIFLFILALLLFGPKKLPVLARELGKWMGEFRRASNEFKMQMEDELRASEQADRQKQIAAMEAAAPIPPPLGEPAEPEHPHTRYNTPDLAPEPSMLAPQPVGEEAALSAADATGASSSATESAKVGSQDAPSSTNSTADGVRPVPIATFGSLNMMPPATGLPTPRSGRPNALSSLVDAIPEGPANGEAADAQRQPGRPASSLAGVELPPTRSAETESLAHGD